ncbi:glycosyltransferase family 2 protein [Lactococcus lactis]|uniref:glycosyltransferase family 2 protein n=1 Tax=Lactococcus lactis TaxID=1358 RepID=UPI001F0D096A|nr:glycosyltransferase family A protein [Lactococcus lactis]MCH5427896.1 glycosyltransferase family 2 protein [Lactococcus lactis]
MKKTISISVILTTHNRINDLKKAVESVFRQTFSDYELLIVNDNSTDGTKKYIEDLSSKNPNVKAITISAEESRGGNYARNKGVALSSGEYIAFLDDDDFWLEKKLEQQFSQIQLNPKVGLIYCGIERRMNGKLLERHLPSSEDLGDMSKRIFTHVITVSSAIMIRKSIFEKVGGFDEELTHWQEYDLMIRIAQESMIDYVNEILVIINDSKRDTKKVSNNLQQWLIAVDKINKKYEMQINNLDVQQKMAKEKYFLTDLAGRYYKLGFLKEHRGVMLRLWKLTRQKRFFVRYLFNLNYIQISRLRNLKKRILG